MGPIMTIAASAAFAIPSILGATRGAPPSSIQPPPWKPFECREFSDGRFECKPNKNSGSDKASKIPKCVETYKFRVFDTKEMWWYCKGFGEVSKEKAKEIEGASK